MTLLFVWSTVMFLATLGQNRFVYYLVVNVAVLTGYACSKGFELAGFRGILRWVAIPILFFLVYYPNLGLAIDASAHDLGPGDDWFDALSWMKQNTPDPFQDSSY